MFGSDLRKAGVVEPVDTRDLGSRAFLAWGFESLRPHHPVMPFKEGAAISSCVGSLS